MADLQSLADSPDTLREYETIYILRPDTPNDRVADINERVRGIIEKMGGKVLEVDNWGRRRLAYDIASHTRGIYLFWQYLGSPTAVAEFERNMRMFDSVIRYMTVKLEESIDPQARTSGVDEESYERAATTASADEELAAAGDEGDAGEAEGTEAEGAEAGGTEAGGAEAGGAEAGAGGDKEATPTDDGDGADTPDEDKE